MLSFHTFGHFVLTAALAVVVHQYWAYRQLVKKNDCNALPSVDDNRAPSVQETTNVSEIGDSAVWCWGSNRTDRLCRFRNLCYIPADNEFLFLHGPESVYVGLPFNRYDSDSNLLDMSSVADHNTQYFNFMDAVGDEVRRKFADRRTRTVLHGTYVIFRRFHPINLMHVFHDDLLPMYNTLLMLPESNVKDFSSHHRVLQRLVFADGHGPGPFEELYNLFSVERPIYKEDLHSMNNLVCFSDSFVGLFKHSTWYQYGFTKPQGPIPGYSVTSTTVRRFCNYIRRQLNISQAGEVADRRSLVLLSRKHNRLIVNEAELIFGLAQTLRVKVVSVALESNSLSEIIAAVSSASIVIGMHGSLLSVAMFLPRASILVELFPYAVNPDHYTPYRTLADIPGMEIHYLAWRNPDINRTVAYPNRLPEEGGIVHLSQDRQASIVSSKEVPRHLCCTDPEWLYRIYQDTFVDVSTIVGKIADIRDRLSVTSETTNDRSVDRQLFPSFVRNVSCQSGVQHELPFLFISWQSPSNLVYLNGGEVKYEVWIQEEGMEEYSAWMLTKFEHSFTAGIQPSTNYVIWVRCLIGETVGPFSLNPVMCSTQ